MKQEVCKETDYFDKLYERVLELRTAINEGNTFRVSSIMLELGNLIRPRASEKYKEK